MIAPMSPAPSVLHVFVVWHPASTTCGDLARDMFRALDANPDIPASRGLGIPVRFRTSSVAEVVPAAVPFGSAVHTAVFVLVDDEFAADTQWRSYAEGLAASCGAADVVVPVAITKTANLPPQLAALQAIRLDGVGADDVSTALLNGAMRDLCQLLDPDAAKVRVFLSHAKGDGLDLTTEVRRHLREDAGLDDFFDATDIPDGAMFADYMTKCAGSLPVLLAVHTDSYSSREWCRLEVLEAKRSHVPIVVLSASVGREARSFPYMGNVPVVRWKDSSSLPHVVGLLLGEVLRDRFFPLRGAAICAQMGLDAEADVFAFPPELVTVLTHRAEVIAAGGKVGRYLYPDPPLGTEELMLLLALDADLDPVTPTMLMAQ